MTFGKWIKEKRQAAGLTLEELGNIVGCGKSNLSKLERGAQNGINICKVRPLCKALNVTTDELVDAWEEYGSGT